MLSGLNKIRYDVGYKNTLIFLYDGNMGTIFYLQQVQIYKRWRDIFNWLVVNNIQGQKLVEFFQNESDRDKGTMVGITYVINKLEGHKIGPMRGLHVTDLL